ncbi:MAG: hypothetical protein GXP15_01885 [Gammaproteobacteria bacterium]|nr:hypothetical protein [Gammaproteobacteria bacterium]
MDEHDLIYSKHCQSVMSDGITVKLEIYSSGDSDWILEVVDEENNSTVWDNPFSTDDEAYQEFQRTLAEDGIESMIGLDQSDCGGDEPTAA